MNPAVPLLCLAALVSCTSSKVTHTSYEKDAIAAFAKIRANDCAPVVAEFDPFMASRLTPQQLCQGFPQYESILGAYESAGAPHSVRRGSLTVVQVPLTLDRSAGELRVTYDKNGKIAGLYFLKPGIPVP